MFTNNLKDIVNNKMNNEILIHILIIAHPDDESMFFIPTINYLREQMHNDDDNILLWVICLTTGNYDGIGMKRQQELINVINMLDCVSKLIIINDEDIIPDHSNHSWNIELVSDYLNQVIITNISDYHKQHQQQKQKRQKQQQQQQQNQQQGSEQTTTSQDETKSVPIHINIITFDEYGVSGHCNHRDTYLTVNHWLNRYCQYHLIERKDKSYVGYSMLLSYHINNNNNNERKLETIQYKTHVNVINHWKYKQEYDDVVVDNNYKIEALPTIAVTAWTLHSIRNPILKYIPIRSWIYLLFIYIFSHIISLRRCWATIIDYDNNLLSLPSIKKESLIPMSIEDLKCYRHLKQHKQQQQQEQRIISIYSYHPTVNWISMKTHISQFVWYRRLFIIFSCYTYENQLRSMITMNEYGNLSTATIKMTKS